MMSGITRLAKYEVLEELGRGGFAVVYKALDTSPLKRTVALKVLAPHLAQDPAFVARFMREARVAANLRHPNIVVIFEVGEDQGQYYIAMEYLDGDTLDEIIARRGALPLEWVAGCAVQIGSALDYAHPQGVIHRDVKPRNIFVNDQGHVTLVDFGLVKAVEESRLTVTGQSLGTPEYMSPEQAQLDASQPLDYRSDVYSFAVVLFEMCTGRAPFTGDNPSAILYKHVYEPPPRPSTLNPSLFTGVEDALLQSLAKDPNQRHQTAGALAQALQQIAQGRRPPPIPPETEGQKRARQAAVAELLGWFGFLGVGWLLAHRTGVGIALLIGWWVVMAAMAVLTLFTVGISLCIWGPLHITVPIVSALLLYNTSRKGE